MLAGRVYARENMLDEARDYYCVVHAVFTAMANGDEQRLPAHTLDNAVWWLKIEHRPLLCLQLSWQAWQLADKALNRRRQAQIALLLTCRPLANRVFTR